MLTCLNIRTCTFICRNNIRDCVREAVGVVPNKLIIHEVIIMALSQLHTHLPSDVHTLGNGHNSDSWLFTESMIHLVTSLSKQIIAFTNTAYNEKGHNSDLSTTASVINTMEYSLVLNLLYICSMPEVINFRPFGRLCVGKWIWYSVV